MRAEIERQSLRMWVRTRQRSCLQTIVTATDESIVTMYPTHLDVL